VWRNVFNEDVCKLFDDVALSTPEQNSLGWQLNKDGWVSQKETGGYFGGSRAVGKPRAWACNVFTTKGHTCYCGLFRLPHVEKIIVSVIPGFIVYTKLQM
jgi:hypothetical protein